MLFRSRVKNLFDEKDSRIDALAFCGGALFAAINRPSAGPRTGSVERIVRDERVPKVFALGIPGVGIRDLDLTTDCGTIASAWDDETVRLSVVDDAPDDFGKRTPGDLRAMLGPRLGL